MPFATGANAQIIIQEEETFKTDPASPAAQRVHFISSNLSMKQNLIDSKLIRANRNPFKPARGNKDVMGNIVTELQAYIGRIFKGVLGAVTTTGASPYTHVFKIASSLPSFLIEQGFTDINQYFKYNGCKFTRMSFNIVPEGFQELTVDVMGAKETAGTSSYDSSATDLGVMSWEGFAISSILEGGVAIADVAEITGFTIENNLDGKMYVIGGAGERVALPEGTVKVSGTIKTLFEDATLFNKAIAGTESSLKVIFTQGDGLGSAGNESIEILVPELIFSPQTPAIPGPEGIFMELPFTAYYTNSSEASALQITLKNTQATI